MKLPSQLKDRIAKTIDYLKNIKQSEIDGTESKEISIAFPSGQTRQFTGQSLLLGNSLPNFYFHATTAYDIIRQCGVELGKQLSFETALRVVNYAWLSGTPSPEPSAAQPG
jgi:uncharacterized protein